MKQLLISAIVAAAVSIIVFEIVERLEDDDEATNIDALAAQLAGNKLMNEKFHPTVLDYTMEPAEDAWVNGARTTGTDFRSLSDASRSICYITKIEIKGVQGPEDSNSCRVSIDDFTGFWQLTAEVGEGGQSEVRCNARCLVWGNDESTGAGTSE
jgi:hypothetical protein